jgi:hypothetical protein
MQTAKRDNMVNMGGAVQGSDTEFDAARTRIVVYRYSITIKKADGGWSVCKYKTGKR